MADPLSRRRFLALAASVSLVIVLVATLAVVAGVFDGGGFVREDEVPLQAGGNDAPPEPVSLELTVCIDNDTWQRPTLEEQIAQIEADRRYAPWNGSLLNAFTAAFHFGAGPATGRPNPLGKLVLFSGLWTAGDSKQLYAELEKGCPVEPNVVRAPDLIDLWLLGYEAGEARLEPDRIVVSVKSKPAGFQAVQLRFPGRASDYALPIDFVDASGQVLYRL